MAEEEKNIEVQDFIKTHKTPVVALPENSGIVVDGDIAEVVGYNKIVVVNLNFGRHIFRPGEIFGL